MLRLNRGLRFLHLMTDVWTERHGLGSNGSLVPRCMDPTVLAVAKLHFNGARFMGHYEQVNIEARTRRFLFREGVRDCHICSSTSDAGANVKKALSEWRPRWMPCAAHTMHLAVKASLGISPDTAPSLTARRECLSLS